MAISHPRRLPLPQSVQCSARENEFLPQYRYLARPAAGAGIVILHLNSAKCPERIVCLPIIVSGC